MEVLQAFALRMHGNADSSRRHDLPAGGAWKTGRRFGGGGGGREEALSTATTLDTSRTCSE